ncbi:MAG TPA: class I SAM-dependent methyltransferase [Pyrinomonadaceae bacterium]|nr:class I SAM-dependent methyltransferase [Pyrinomonadaceae bacterium]
MENRNDLQEWFGGIDIYIFDQLLKGRFVPGMKVLDAGCGAGRNLVYFLRSGYEVFGVDEEKWAIERVRKLAAVLAPRLPAENFWVGKVEELSAAFADCTDGQLINNGPAMLRTLAQPLPGGEELGGTDKTEIGGIVDVVLSSAVLHFARDEQQWQAMVDAMWSVLKPGGIFFARLASTIGIENQVNLIEGRRYRLPDGSDRFLVDAAMLHRVTDKLGGEFVEPIKTTVVENMRAMTTWVAGKK